MRFPELTEKQKAELSRIKTAGTDVGYQVLLGLIAIDLMQDKAYGHPLSPEDYLLCLPNPKRYTLKEYFFPDDIFHWVEKMSGFKGEVTERKRKEWASLTFALLDAFANLESFMTGKKYKELIVFFKEQDDLLYSTQGYCIEHSPEYAYRFIMACIEYMGYSREPNEDTEIVDVSEMPFDGFII